jgi:hypothetical protein
MTSAQFRKIALSLADAEEREHMGHPDFRVAGRIFATLSHPDNKSGMVSLTPELQADYVRRDPDTFEPAKGGWGLKGSTKVKLPTANPEIIGEALTDAWRNTKLKAGTKKPASKRSG